MIVRKARAEGERRKEEKEENISGRGAADIRSGSRGGLYGIESYIW